MKVTRKSRHAKIIAATERAAIRNIDEGVREGTQVMEQLCRVDTGYMKSRIVGKSENGHGMHENDTPYAKFNEFGTRKMGAQPFFRPGRDRTIEKIKSGMRIAER